jgi:hypothetical protein
LIQHSSSSIRQVNPLYPPYSDMLRLYLKLIRLLKLSESVFWRQCGPIKCCCTASCSLLRSNKGYYNYKVLSPPNGPVCSEQINFLLHRGHVKIRLGNSSSQNLSQKLVSEGNMNMDPSHAAALLHVLH